MSEFYTTTRKGIRFLVFGDDKKISEANIKAALDHCGFISEEKPYIFKAGDVASWGESKNEWHRRIICAHPEGGLIAYDMKGQVSCGKRPIQSDFESAGYNFVGKFVDFLPKDE